MGSRLVVTTHSSGANARTTDNEIQTDRHTKSDNEAGKRCPMRRGAMLENGWGSTSNGFMPQPAETLREAWLPAEGPAERGASMSPMAAAEAGLYGGLTWDLMLATSGHSPTPFSTVSPGPHECILLRANGAGRAFRWRVTDCGSFDSHCHPPLSRVTPARGIQ